MKTIIKALLFALAAFIVTPAVSEVKAQTATHTVTALNSQTDFSGYIGVKDTLTNTDTTIYNWKIAGKRHCLTFTVDVTKLTGTVAGKFEIYASANGGLSYVTAPIKTVNKTDATNVLTLEMTNNGYTDYKIMSISSGTNTHAQRVSATIRRLD